jgi:hypothetical protein
MSLLFMPQAVINMKSNGEVILTEETEELGEKPVPVYFVHLKSPMDSDTGPLR